jgi:hypothetical protein
MLRVKKRHLSSQAATRDPGGSRLLAHLLALVATQRWPSWACLNGVGTSILQRSSPIVSVTVTGCMRPGQMLRVNLDFRSKASSMRGPNFKPQRRREGGERGRDGNRNKATDRPLGFIIGPHHLAQRH